MQSSNSSAHGLAGLFSRPFNGLRLPFGLSRSKPANPPVEKLRAGGSIGHGVMTRQFGLADFLHLGRRFSPRSPMMAFLRKAVGKLRPKPGSLQDRYPHYQIGQGSYGADDLRIHSWGEGATLSIGAYCSIAERVQIFLGGEHRTDWVTTYPFSFLWPSAKAIPGHPRTKGDVVIGNDVWIATGAIILSGVTIGDGAVIGAGSVVAKDVPPYAIVAGNPARLVKERFDQDTVKRLRATKWWEWEKERIEKALPLLLSRQVERFLSAVEHRDI